MWTKAISDNVIKGLKDSSRYKHVCQVMISQKLGQGTKVGQLFNKLNTLW